MPTDADLKRPPRIAMELSFITRIVEAALLASQQPLTLAQLQALFTLDEPAAEGGIEQALEHLREGCATRGIELVETASGYRFQVQADVHAWVARLWTERQTKYTRATLETLAIIAYRQPITRGEIEQIRGVAVSSNIIKALEEREWIRSVGHRDVPGRPELLGTTRTFLDYFGLKRLEDLPPLSELKDFAELDPQLAFADPDAPRPQTGRAIAANVSTEGQTDAEIDHAMDADGDAPADADAADARAGAANDRTAAPGQTDDGGAGAPADTDTDTDTHTDTDLDGDDNLDAASDLHPPANEHDDDGDNAAVLPADLAEGDDAFPSPPRDAADAADPDHDNALVDDDDSTGARHEP